MLFLSVPPTAHTSVRPGVCILTCHSDLCLHHVQVKVLCVNATPHSTLQPPQMPTFALEQPSTQPQDSLFMGLNESPNLYLHIYERISVSYILITFRPITLFNMQYHSDISIFKY